MRARVRPAADDIPSNGQSSSSSHFPIPAHVAALRTLDEVEAHIDALTRRLASLPPGDPSIPSIRVELAHSASQRSAVRAQGRYLALLSCAALVVCFCVALLAGWRLPIVAVHDLVNSVRRERMATMGMSEGAMAADHNDFASAFDWVSWLWKERPAVGVPR